MNYVKHLNSFVVPPDDFNKYFYNIPTIKPALDKIFNLVEGGAISDDDIKIIEFLFKVQFATFAQIVRFCNINGIKKIHRRINLMFNCSAITKFSFVDHYDDNSSIPKDALLVYCLTEGGKSIIDKYTSLATFNWECSVIYQSTRNIADRLIGTEFYLNMLAGEKSVITNVSSDYHLAYKKDKLRSDMVYRILSSGSIYYVIGNVVRGDMDIFNLRDMLHRYDSFFITNAYTKYFPDAVAIPYLVFICDSDQTIAGICNEVVSTSKLTNILYTTVERFSQGLGLPGAFLVYNASTNQITDATFKMF